MNLISVIMYTSEKIHARNTTCLGLKAFAGRSVEQMECQTNTQTGEKHKMFETQETYK